jgi:ATP-dependent RNA helicase DeaD
MTFEQLALRPETLRAIQELKYVEPTPIQRESIPLLAQGIDLIGQAMTGSGKTAAFGIHIIEHVDTSKRRPQALVLAPTRELAVQVAAEMQKLAKHYRMSIVTVYGGASINRQAQELHHGAQVVVGTPGRILDMIRRGVLHLNEAKIVVLDEADRMLDMGFIDDVQTILDETPKERQTMLFSATMPPEIRNLARTYMRNPESLTVSSDAVPLDKIKQTFVLVERVKKFPVLLNILKTKKPALALIFVRTKFGADKLARGLYQKGHRAMAIHGNLSQNRRDKAMYDFKHGHIHMLVATDIAARGLDVSGITHVINYDLPDEPTVYSHRVGRTARAGANGQAISLVMPEQYQELTAVQRTNGLKIEREMIDGCITSQWFTDQRQGSHSAPSHHHSKSGVPSYKFGDRYDTDY